MPSLHADSTIGSNITSTATSNGHGNIFLRTFTATTIKLNCDNYL